MARAAAEATHIPQLYLLCFIVLYRVLEAASAHVTLIWTFLIIIIIIMAAVRTGLQAKRAKPRDVYEALVTANDSDNRPRDHKQVRNQAQTIPTGGCRKGLNVADDVLNVLGSVQNSSFVKHVALAHGKQPVIVAYTEEQMWDMSRFCSSTSHTTMRSVLGVDRTFNLGPCFVTVCVYRNMSVVRKNTLQHPVFLGPVMFHFDGKADTYKVFFRTVHDALSSEIQCAEVNGDVEVVFGSDEEKAVVTALKQVFVGVQHVFCAIHIEDNVRRFLTDDAGIPVKEREQLLASVQQVTHADCNSTIACEEQLTQLIETTRGTAAAAQQLTKLLNYVNDKLIPKLRNNIQVSSVTIIYE